MSEDFKVHMPARPASRAPKSGAAQADLKQEAVKAAAERAKAEAAERRKQAPKRTPEEAARKERELGGPEGPEPTRYGDWEKKGICYDF